LDISARCPPLVIPSNKFCSKPHVISTSCVQSCRFIWGTEENWWRKATYSSPVTLPNASLPLPISLSCRKRVHVHLRQWHVCIQLAHILRWTA
jgi:hypothetical protein